MRRGIIEVNKEENRGFVYSVLRRPGQREPRLGQFTFGSVSSKKMDFGLYSNFIILNS